MSKPVMIINISNDSVGGLLLNPLYNKEEKRFCSPVNHVIRIPLPFQQNLNSARFLEQTVVVLKEVLDKIIKLAGKHPSKVVCFLSAPFYASQARTVRRRNPKPFRVTAEMIRSLISEDLKQFIERVPQIFPEIIGTDHQIIESKTMQVKLNRYQTRLPLDKVASEIELYHYVSVGSRRLLGRFQEVVHGFLPHAVVEFHSLPFALFSVCRDHFDGRRGRLLIDIGAEISEVLLLSDDVLWESVSFPLGRNGLIRELVNSLKTVPEEAVSTLKIYQQGEKDKISREKIVPAISKFKDKWLEFFKESLKSLSEDHLISREIMVVGDPLVIPLFLEWLKNEKFEPNLLSSKIIADHCSRNLEALPRYEHLMIGSLFYDKILETVN